MLRVISLTVVGFSFVSSAISQAAETDSPLKAVTAAVQREAGKNNAGLPTGMAREETSKDDKPLLKFNIRRTYDLDADKEAIAELPPTEIILDRIKEYVALRQLPQRDKDKKALDDLSASLAKILDDVLPKFAENLERGKLMKIVIAKDAEARGALVTYCTAYAANRGRQFAEGPVHQGTYFSVKITLTPANGTVFYLSKLDYILLTSIAKIDADDAETWRKYWKQTPNDTNVLFGGRYYFRVNWGTKTHKSGEIYINSNDFDLKFVAE